MNTTWPLSMDAGQRFSPTDEEIVNHFLKLKLLGNDHEVCKIPDLDIYQFDPWDLPQTNSNDRERYFFSLLNGKYYSDGPINRSTNTGSWQASGRDKIVMSETGEEIGKRKIFVHSVIRDGIKWVMHEYRANFNLPNQRALVLCKVKKKPYKAKRVDKKTRQPNKKAKRADKKARQPNKKAKIPTSYEGQASRNLDSDFEEQSTHQETDLSTYKEDEKIGNSTCDKGGSNHLMTPASQNYVAENTILDQVDSEILPYLESFPGYNQQDYSLNFALD